MSDRNSKQYMKFKEERTRPSKNLLSAVEKNFPVRGDENVILKMPRLFFTAKKIEAFRLYFTVYLIFLYSDGERDLKRLNILLK